MSKENCGIMKDVLLTKNNLKVNFSRSGVGRLFF